MKTYLAVALAGAIVLGTSITVAGQGGSLLNRAPLKTTTKTQGDFNLSNRFSVEIDGVPVPGVHSVDGLESESDLTVVKPKGLGAPSPYPGEVRPNVLTITKDWSNTPEFYKWRKAVLDGKVDRRSISVIFHNDAGNEAGRMNFYNCWPAKWKGPSLSATSSGHATESIQIAWETMELKAG